MIAVLNASAPISISWQFSVSFQLADRGDLFLPDVHNIPVRTIGKPAAPLKWGEARPDSPPLKIAKHDRTSRAYSSGLDLYILSAEGCSAHTLSCRSMG